MVFRIHRKTSSILHCSGREDDQAAYANNAAGSSDCYPSRLLAAEIAARFGTAGAAFCRTIFNPIN